MNKNVPEPTEIHLIVAESIPTVVRREREADKGGKEQGLREFLDSFKQPTTDFKAQLERALHEINVILDVAAKAKFPTMTFESMEVGIAISAKGSIGIVTAGVDASLKLKFKAA
jgi:hypothetical protein